MRRILNVHWNKRNFDVVCPIFTKQNRNKLSSLDTFFVIYFESFFPWILTHFFMANHIFANNPVGKKLHFFHKNSQNAHVLKHVCSKMFWNMANPADKPPATVIILVSSWLYIISTAVLKYSKYCLGLSHNPPSRALSFFSLLLFREGMFGFMLIGSSKRFFSPTQRVFFGWETTHRIFF